MTVVLVATTSGAQGVMNRTGEIGNCVNVVNTFALTTLPAAVTGANGLMAIYDGSTSELIRNAIGAVPAALVAQQDTGLATIRNALRAAWQNTVIEMAAADDPLNPPRSVLQALEEIKQQMVASVDSVDANEPTIGQSNTGTGTGPLVLSLLDGKGKTLENAYHEVLELSCTTPQVGLVSTGWPTNGVFTILGEAAESNKLSHKWPKGSGASGTMPVRSAWSSDNLVTNGTFEAFTVANTPDNWTIDGGAAGSTIFADTGSFTGIKALRFTGDGATQIGVRQAIVVTAYAPIVLSVWIKVNTSAPAAGVLQIALVNGAGTILNDEAGTANSFTVDLTTLTTSYQCFTGVFRLAPAATAGDSSVNVRIKTTTAISNTKEVVMEDVLVQYATQLYVGGPYAGKVCGGVADGLNKVFTVTVTNDYRGAIQTMTHRLSDQTAFYWPSNAAGSETISDGLIG